MKNTVGFVAVVVALLVFVVAGAKAQTVRPLTVNEAVAWGGATHAVTLDVADLTTTNGNTAQTFSVPVLAKPYDPSALTAALVGLWMPE